MYPHKSFNLPHSPCVHQGSPPAEGYEGRDARHPDGALVGGTWDCVRHP